MNEPTFGLTIKIVSERTGVSVHTLRAWERRYGIPAPKRDSDNRYRLYDEQDIADVLWLKQQVEAGIPPAQASALLRQRRHARTLGTTEVTQPLAATQAALVAAFVRSDEVTARRILDEAFALFTPEQVAQHIIEPTMREIGARWMRGEMTVWQEHLASNVVQQKLFAILQAQPALPLAVPTLVAACAPNEEHTLGLLMFSILAQRQGWRVIFLGQATPLDEINRVARTKPNLIVVSVTTALGLVELIPWLDPAQRPAVPIVFGGRIVDALPKLRAHLPGDYLGTEIVAANQLLGFKPRTEFWTPSKRALRAANALRAHRLKIAGDTAVQFLATLTAHRTRTQVPNLNFATLFLVDAITCALAFDVPELLDAERMWLDEMILRRAVPPELVTKHLDTFTRVLGRLFSAEQNRLYQPLVARMKGAVQ
ncbi:MAG: MerR family transcriptional regulator [Anaerolineae bacterium]|nr:MerR family transcriptional regulator [Anaerolineae bacterium]